MDESGYAAILNQVRDQEFQREVDAWAKARVFGRPSATSRERRQPGRWNEKSLEKQVESLRAQEEVEVRAMRGGRETERLRAVAGKSREQEVALAVSKAEEALRAQIAERDGERGNLKAQLSAKELRRRRRASWP